MTRTKLWHLDQANSPTRIYEVAINVLLSSHLHSDANSHLVDIVTALSNGCHRCLVHFSLYLCPLWVSLLVNVSVFVHWWFPTTFVATSSAVWNWSLVWKWKYWGFAYVLAYLSSRWALAMVSVSWTGCRRWQKYVTASAWRSSPASKCLTCLLHLFQLSLVVIISVLLLSIAVTWSMT